MQILKCLKKLLLNTQGSDTLVANMYVNLIILTLGLELNDKHIHVISQYIHTSVCNSVLS